MSATYLSLNVHIVFATKDRMPQIEKEWRPKLHAYVAGTIRGLQAQPKIVGGVADYVHLLVGLKATHAVSDFVREIKKAASGWAEKERRRLTWQVGYGGFQCD